MRILLVSTYELGHQPIHLATACAALEAAGVETVPVDLSLDPLDPRLVEGVDAVAFAVPMHTAMRLAVEAAEIVRARRDLPICFFGLYAAVGAESNLGRVVDHVIVGEWEEALVSWALDSVSGAASDAPTERVMTRGVVPLGRRDGLAPLERYAKLSTGSEQRTAGYVEASRGCNYRCRHCPVPTVYDGRIRIVSADTVLADIDQQVRAGARHITFGDPDFLNGPKHTLAIVEQMAQRHQGVTFDVTVKVEHIIGYRDVWPDMAAAGCVFVVSAVECLNDRTLALLDKGHTADEAVTAVEILRDCGIEMRPSLLPFTPWTSRGDLVDICRFVADNDLVANVDPIHYSIKLLVPDGSLLLDLPEMSAVLGDYDGAALSYEWAYECPEMDARQNELAALADRGLGSVEAFREVVRIVGADIEVADVVSDVPRLTESWFCCAEPGCRQKVEIGGLT